MPTFDICDADKSDGGLTCDELCAPKCLSFLSSGGVDISKVDQIFANFDTDGNELVTFEEFLVGSSKLVNGESD